MMYLNNFDSSEFTEINQYGGGATVIIISIVVLLVICVAAYLFFFSGKQSNIQSTTVPPTAPQTLPPIVPSMISCNLGDEYNSTYGMCLSACKPGDTTIDTICRSSSGRMDIRSMYSPKLQCPAGYQLNLGDDTKCFKL